MQKVARSATRTTGAIAVPGYRVLSISQSEGLLRLELDVDKAEVACPYCQGSITVGYGRRQFSVRDVPLDHLQVVRVINRRRFKCCTCKKTFHEPLPDVAANRRTTVHLVSLVQEMVMRMPFNAIAKQVGLDEKTVRSIAGEHFQTLTDRIQFQPPAVLGVFGLSIGDRPAAMLINLEKSTVVDVLPNYSRRAIRDRVASALLEPRVPSSICVSGEQSLLEGVSAAVLNDRQVDLDIQSVCWQLEHTFAESMASALHAMAKPRPRGVSREAAALLTLARDRLSADQTMQVETILQQWPGLVAAYIAYQELHRIVLRTPFSGIFKAVADWSARHPTKVRRAFRWVESLFAQPTGRFAGLHKAQTSSLVHQALHHIDDILRSRVVNRSSEAVRAMILYVPALHHIDGNQNFGADLSRVADYLGQVLPCKS
jgi:transposase-like protein